MSCSSLDAISMKRCTLTSISIGLLSFMQIFESGKLWGYSLILSRKLIRISTRCSSWVTDPEMFNRSREIERLSKVLAGSPQLSVITGSVNSGKSKLIDHLLCQLPMMTGHSVPVHTFNLREGTFNSIQSLVDSLSGDVKPWLQKVKESIDAISVGKESIKLQLKKDSMPIDQLNSLLKNIADGLSSRFLRRKQQPVIVIDEANRLRSLLCDQNGHTALESLFQWFVLHMKEKRKFHVIMASSDSFFSL